MVTFKKIDYFDGRLRSIPFRQNILAGLITLASVGIVNHNTRMMASFQSRKDYYLSMSLEEKRKHYACGNNYVTLDMIPIWKAKGEISSTSNDPKYPLSIYPGDITKLEVDVIVNAANSRLSGGGGVDGFIHRAAGNDDLQNECMNLGGCETGNCKITGGYRLPAKYIIHCVGPIGEQPQLLASCYRSALTLAKDNNLKSIAFPCISTGVYGYPRKNAANVVLRTIKEWLDSNPDKIERIIFCLFLKEDIAIYEALLPKYFPDL